MGLLRFGFLSGLHLRQKVLEFAFRLRSRSGLCALKHVNLLNLGGECKGSCTDGVRGEGQRNFDYGAGQYVLVLRGFDRFAGLVACRQWANLVRALDGLRLVLPGLASGVAVERELVKSSALFLLAYGMCESESVVKLERMLTICLRGR